MLILALTLAACSAKFASDGDLGPGQQDSTPPGDDTGGTPDDSTPDSTPTDDSGGPPTIPALPVCHAYGPSAQRGTVADDDLDELSGIAVSQRTPGVLWVLEDHLGANVVYALDYAGSSLGKVTLAGAENNDWEDIAVHPCGDTTCVYVGEIGDNDHDRTYHAVLRFPEPVMTLGTETNVTLTPEIFPYALPEDTFIDSEALAILPDGTPVVFSKEYDDEMSTAWAFPELDTAQTVTLVEHGRFSTSDVDDGPGGAVTGADLWPDGSRLLLRTYGHVWEYTLPLVNGLADVSSLDALPTAAREALHTGAERQGEAIGYDTVNRAYWTVAEGAGSALWYTGCADPGK